jgi:CubicO group peptidase (beta-lactamase class C family)
VTPTGSRVHFARRSRRLRAAASLFVLGSMLLAHSASAQDRFPQDSWMQYSSPEEAGWSSQKIQDAKAFADSIGTAAFMLVHDGAIVATHGDVSRRYMVHSIRKSLLSALFGIYTARGRINLQRTLAELGIDDRLPLSDTEKRATVLDLLKARSGVYHPAAYQSETRESSFPARGSHPPGTFWSYNNWDFNALGTIFGKETGEDLFRAFGSEIATKTGMEDFRVRDGYYHLESDRSVHPAYPFRMSTRDLARFGLLFARNGRWNDAQIVPSAWVTESTQSYSETRQPATPGYGYMWWRLGAGFERYGAYAARGTGEQLIAIVPGLKLVFVHRVDTFDVEGERVAAASALALLERLIAARVGEAKANARLTPLQGAATQDPAVRAPIETLRRYARVYVYPSGRTIEVTADEAELRAHFKLRGTFTLHPASENEFILEDAQTRVVFHGEGDELLLWTERLLLDEGANLLRRGSVAAAIATFQRATALYPKSAGSHVRLAQTQQIEKDVAGASQSFAKAIELDPANPEAASALYLLGKLRAPAVSVAARLAEYAGTYRVPGLADEARVTLDSTRLLITLPALAEPCALIPMSQSTFLCPVARGPRTVTFDPNTNGTLARLVVRTATGTRTYERVR